jgi:broad specificity phosphatase PhoE
MTSRRSELHQIRTAVGLGLLALVLCGTGCPQRADATTTAVFLVRHAEKEAGVSNPSLTAEGQARAQALAHALEDAGIQAIYSTEFARTQQTAQAVSEAIGVDVQTFPVGNDGMEAFIAGMASEIRDNQGGRRVLVVGHSNTVPALMRALGATEATDLTEKDYDDLFVVELGEAGSARLLQLHYGADSP